MSRVYVPRDQLSQSDEELLIEAAEAVGFEVEDYDFSLQIKEMNESQAQYLVNGLEHMGIKECWRA